MDEYLSGINRAYASGHIRLDGPQDLWEMADDPFSHYRPGRKEKDGLDYTNCRWLPTLVKAFADVYRSRGLSALELGSGSGVAASALRQTCERQGTLLNLESYGFTPIDPYLDFPGADSNTQDYVDRGHAYDRHLLDHIRELHCRKFNKKLFLKDTPSGVERISIKRVLRLEKALGEELLHRRETPFIDQQWIGEYHRGSPITERRFDLIWNNMGPLNYSTFFNGKGPSLDEGGTSHRADALRVTRDMIPTGILATTSGLHPEVDYGNDYVGVGAGFDFIVREGNPCYEFLKQKYPKRLPHLSVLVNELRELAQAGQS